MGFDYTAQPSAEVANLKAEVERIRMKLDAVHRELDMAHKQRHAIASECDRMKVIADAKHRETEILRHERDALIDVQMREATGGNFYFVMSGYNGCADTRDAAVRIVRRRAGLPETEPIT